jgi:hypothetical protein
MKPRLSKREENRAAAASLLADLDEEFSTGPVEAPASLPINQIDGETRNKPVMGDGETRNKPVMGDGETRNKPVIGTRNGKSAFTKTRNKPVTKPVTESVETRNKPVMDFAFAGATKFQKQILLFIYLEMQKSIDRMTPPMSLHHFGQYLGRTDSKGFESLRIVTLRLEGMGLLSRPVVKNGRGGWTRYSLPQSVYAEVRESETRNELVINPEQTRNKPVTKPVMAASSSSRDLYLNNSTTTQDVDNSESDASALKNIDFSIVTEFGITSSTLNRCKELYPSVSNDQLVALTERFGQFMKTSDGKRVQNARGFFISLAEQLSKGVTPLDHIETNQEALMREFVDRSKEAKTRRELLEKEAFEFAFDEWIESLDSKRRDQLVPVTSVIESGSKIQTMKLKEHFRLSVWPTRFAVSKEAHGVDG